MALRRLSDYIVGTGFYQAVAQRWRWLKWVLGALGIAAIVFGGFLSYHRLFPPPAPPEASFEDAWRSSQRSLQDHEAILKLSLLKVMMRGQGTRGEALVLLDSLGRSLREAHLLTPGSTLVWTDLDALLDQLTLQVGTRNPAIEQTVDAIIALLAGVPE